MEFSPGVGHVLPKGINVVPPDEQTHPILLGGCSPQISWSESPLGTPQKKDSQGFCFDPTSTLGFMPLRQKKARQPEAQVFDLLRLWAEEHRPVQGSPEVPRRESAQEIDRAAGGVHLPMGQNLGVQFAKLVSLSVSLRFITHFNSSPDNVRFTLLRGEKPQMANHKQ